MWFGLYRFCSLWWRWGQRSIFVWEFIADSTSLEAVETSLAADKRIRVNRRLEELLEGDEVRGIFHSDLVLLQVVASSCAREIGNFALAIDWALLAGCWRIERSSSLSVFNWRYL